MPLIEIAPELTRTNDLLERIALALEMILLQQWGVRTKALTRPLDDPHPETKPTVQYSTDDQEVEEKLKELAGMFRRAKDQDDADESEPPRE